MFAFRSVIISVFSAEAWYKQRYYIHTETEVYKSYNKSKAGTEVNKSYKSEAGTEVNKSYKCKTDTQRSTRVISVK
jgi:hypothetical protein